MKRLLLCLMLVAPSLGAQTITITNATVVDVATGALHPTSTIVIDGARIASVGASSARASGRVVDATGLYVIPGLWDMHVHAYFGWDRAFGDSWVMPLFIANGVTGVRDMGSDLEPVLRARREVAAHTLVGPRMVVSGPMLDGPKVTFSSSLAISSAADGRAAVERLASRGVDFIKLQSGVPRDAFGAIAAAAKTAHLEFVGHVPDAMRASEAIAAGQHTFEHLIGIFEASMPAADETAFLARHYGAAPDTAHNKSLAVLLKRYDAARETAIIKQIAASRVWQCPTLYWERGQWLVDVIDFTKDPDIAYTPRTWVAKKYPKMRTAIAGSLGTDSIAVRRRFVEHELDIVRKLHSAGVPFLAGTDTPAGVDVTPGISLHQEMQRFVAAGFTPLQALQTATINPARFFGKTSDFGAVEKGRVADLVLLRANPLADIANTRAIAGVVADGRYWSSESLDSLRMKVRRYAATHQIGRIGWYAGAAGFLARVNWARERRSASVPDNPASFTRAPPCRSPPVLHARDPDAHPAARRVPSAGPRRTRAR